MLAKWFALLLCLSPLYSQATHIRFADLDLRLGEPKSEVLSKFNGRNDLRQLEMPSGTVQVSRRMLLVDQWVTEGSLSFEAGKLSTVMLVKEKTEEEVARTLAKTLYSETLAGEKVGFTRFWTSVNDLVDAPMHELHFLFKDREVILHIVKIGGKETVAVSVHYPRRSK